MIEEDPTNSHLDLAKKESEDLCKQVVGLTFDAAKELLAKHNKTIRVYKRNAAYQILTRDYRINRINVGLVDDVVIDAHVG